MGVDVCTYRARIGSFLACRVLVHGGPERFVASAGLVRGLCPRVTSVLSACLVLLLLCAGDVESNPGPKIEDVLVLLRECHDETSATLSELKLEITNIIAKVNLIEKAISSVPQFHGQFTAVNNSVQQVKQTVAKTNDELAEVVDDLNNRMRRNNLIVKGLPEVEREGYKESEEIVREFFSTHLQLEVGDIERAHRIGQRRSGAQRPIIVKFLNFKAKSEVLLNASKLKNLEWPKVWLEEDFSPKIQLARKKLRDFVKSTRTENEKYNIRFNSLHFRDSVFRYNPVSDSVIKVFPTAQ